MEEVAAGVGWGVGSEEDVVADAVVVADVDVDTVAVVTSDVPGQSGVGGDTGGGGVQRRARSPAVSSTMTLTSSVVSVAVEDTVREDVSAISPAISSIARAVKSVTMVTSSVVFPSAATFAAPTAATAVADAGAHILSAREGASTVCAAASAAETASLASVACWIDKGDLA